MLDAEALAHELARRLDAQGLRRVVARAHDGNAELARERAEVLLRLAREQRVGSDRRGLERDPAGPAGADRERAQALGPAGERDRDAARDLCDALGQGLQRDGSRN